MGTFPEDVHLKYRLLPWLINNDHGHWLHITYIIHLPCWWTGNDDTLSSSTCCSCPALPTMNGQGSTHTLRYSKVRVPYHDNHVSTKYKLCSRVAILPNITDSEGVVIDNQGSGLIETPHFSLGNALHHPQCHRK